MIISHIIGGLGNQMFQYAAGRALALRNQAELKLDVSDFIDYDLHQGFELCRLFDIDVRMATVEDKSNLLGWQASPRVRKMLKRTKLFSCLEKRTWVKEPHFNYWSGLREVGDMAYIEGYWQSEKYFLEIEDRLRKDFIFPQPFSKKNAEIARKIEQVTAVSLHIRRGDYLSNANSTAIHGLCSLGYYQAAIQYIVAHVNSPCFFVFSDDIVWAKENLKLPFPCQFIDHNEGVESYNDMRLMSLCQHHIIANSSFSWWGAWLNSNVEKMVIAPKHWFVSEVMQAQAVDIYPEKWIKL